MPIPIFDQRYRTQILNIYLTNAGDTKKLYIRICRYRRYDNYSSIMQIQDRAYKNCSMQYKLRFWHTHRSCVLSHQKESQQLRYYRRVIAAIAVNKSQQLPVVIKVLSQQLPGRYRRVIAAIT